LRLLLWLLIAAVLLTGWSLQGIRIVPRAYELPLGPCVVDVFTDEDTLVVACPGYDMLRVRPLPVERLTRMAIFACVTYIKSLPRQTGHLRSDNDSCLDAGKSASKVSNPGESLTSRWKHTGVYTTS
jgi:hypothetical protein